MNDSAVITKAENRQVDDSAADLKDTHSNCTHCSTTITDGDKAVFSNNGDAFCCWGCETVYKILKKGNFSLINRSKSLCFWNLFLGGVSINQKSKIFWALSGSLFIYFASGFKSLSILL